MVLSTHGTPGRFGNQLIRNICVSMLAKKFDLRTEYTHMDDIRRLGIFLHNGNREFHENLDTSEQDILDMLEDKRPFPNKNCNLYQYFQTRTYTLMIYNFLREQKQTICDANPYKERYGKNQDAFVHVRLGDIGSEGWNPSFEYYKKALENIPFENIYVTSDSPDHEVCKKIFSHFPNVNWVPDIDIVPTFQFGSTCKYVILSHGTFSSMIGQLAFDSEIYYPPPAPVIWYGDVNCIPNSTMVVL